jgi:hypothetical protein
MSYGMRSINMGARSRWRSHFQENKTLFIILAVGLFLVELEIFAMASILLIIKPYQPNQKLR